MSKKLFRGKIMVLGAGAIGSLLAAKLTQEFVTEAIGRKEHVQAIKKRGLKISGIINRVFQIRATTIVSKIEEDTIIILTTKSQDCEAAIKQIKKYLTGKSVIVCFQNGVGAEEKISRLVPCKVVRAVTYLAAEMTAPGEVKFVGNGITFFGEDGGEIAEIFDAAGLKTKLVSRIKDEVWKKLVLNCVVNGLGTILNVPNYQLYNGHLDAAKKSIVNECRMVANKEGVKLDKNILDEINKFIRHSRNINSTLQDIRRKKETEIEYLNGAVVRLGKKYGLSVPANSLIYSLIRFAGVGAKWYDVKN